jgi:DNA polymerase-3 subunit alpha
MSNSFSHLQIHTHYSVSEGLCRAEDIATQAALGNISACAITDKDNLFAWVKFYLTMRSSGIKPICGVDILFTLLDTPIEATLLCLNNDGYQSLVSLVSQSYLNSKRIGNRPAVDLDTLLNASGIVIIIHSNCYMNLMQQNKEERFQILLAPLLHLLESRRLFASLKRVSHASESLNVRWANWVSSLHIPLVALNGVCFMSESEYQAHEIRVCIDQSTVIQNKNRVIKHTKHQYFKTAQEMNALFSDAKIILDNTEKLSKRCNVTIEMNKVYLPEVTSENIGVYFAKMVKSGLALRLKKLVSKAKKDEIYHTRIEREIETINDMGFSSYFLIVADFIRWSKLNGVPVGPGRGSGAGSLAAYALGITDIDPLEYDLLFERFLNPERVSMPDFDIDFCMVGRDRVIDYVAKKYGRENVSQIITYGRMAAKAVIRDVGRVLGHPYGFVDKLAKLIPFDLGITLDKAMVQEPMLAKRYEQEYEVRQLMDLCRTLEGLVRNVGTHAGGVVIAPSKISDYSPIYCDSEQNSIVSQFDKDDIEKIGLVKFDFLGLRTLTTIHWAIDNIKVSKGIELDITEIPLDDEKTFELLQACTTTGVFQLESQGMKELIDRLAPDCFEDIVALVALYRPGPLQSGMVDDFVKRKHGIEEVVYHHPLLEPILNETYGVILYQEQVMRIAQDMAGFSLGSADLLRRAMGKKKFEEMEKQRSVFLEGAVAAKIDKNVALEIFNLIEKFAGYGFNKSHSAAYALISYQTAWLKANYPTEFMASVLSSDMDNTDKVIHFLEDVAQMGLKVLPPCINESKSVFSVVEEGVIRYGLSAIKGVGGKASEKMVEARKDGSFKDLVDLSLRVDKINKKLLESLIKSGACDVWGVDRGSLLASIDKAVMAYQKANHSQQQGQQDLFGGTVSFDYVDAPIISTAVKLQFERDSLGYFLTGHPLTDLRLELSNFGMKKLSNVSTADKNVKIAAVINKIKVVKTKKGARIAFVEVTDESGRIDVAFFDEAYTEFYDLIGDGGILIIEGPVSLDKFTQKPRLQCIKAETFENFRAQRSKQLVIYLKDIKEDSIASLSQILSTHKGRTKIQVIYQSEKGDAEFILPITTEVNSQLLSQLNSAQGVYQCQIMYKGFDHPVTVKI